MRNIVYSWIDSLKEIATFGLMIAALFIFIFIVSLPALPFLLGKSVILTCNRLEANYVNCQQQRVHFYGLWPEPVSSSIRVTNAVIKNYEIKDEDGTFTGYKIYFNNKKQSREIYDYRDDFNRALKDKQRIENFIIGRGNASVNMKVSKSFWGEIALIPLGFGYIAITAMGLFFMINRYRLSRISKR